jgi:WD40 repeat protein
MSARLATFLFWLAPVVALSGSILWVGPRTVWREMFMASADPEEDVGECCVTSVFTLDHSAEGGTVLCGLRGTGTNEASLLVWTDVGAQRRVPAAESMIAQDVFWHAALFPDGQSLLVGGPNAGISRVDLQSGGMTLVRSADSSATMTTLVVAPCGRLFAVGRGADVLVFDAQNGQERLRLSGPASSVADIAFSIDGQRMATARGNGEIQLWNRNSGELIHVLPGHTGPTVCIRFAGDGRRLASVGLDGSFRLWNAETAEQLWSEAGDGRGLRELAVAPDGHTAAVGGFAGIVRIYDLDSRRERKTLDEHTRSITALQFISQGQHLISAANDGLICYWDAANDFSLVGVLDFNIARR